MIQLLMNLVKSLLNITKNPKWAYASVAAVLLFVVKYVFTYIGIELPEGVVEFLNSGLVVAAEFILVALSAFFLKLVNSGNTVWKLVGDIWKQIQK